MTTLRPLFLIIPVNNVSTFELWTVCSVEVQKVPIFVRCVNL